ncbi:hypothetical protein MTO96_042735 [Rhipicephalus appendiculatus]
MQRHIQLGTPRTPEELLQIMKLLLVQPRQSSAREVTTAEMFPAPAWPDPFSEPEPSTKNTRQTKKRKFIKGCSDDLSSQTREKIYLTDRAKLIYVPAQVNGKEVKALVVSGASITVINKDVIPQLSIRKDCPVIVYGYDGRKHTL